MALRILLIVNTLPPDDISGVGEQVVQLAGGLRAAGHEVEILGRGRGPNAAGGSKLLFPLRIVLPFLRCRRRFRPHVIQVHESDGALAALSAAAFGGLWSPAPLVVALLQVSYVEEIRAVRALRDRDGKVLGRPSAVERRFQWLKAPLQVVLGWLTTWCADLVLTPSARTGAEVRRDYGAATTYVLPNAKEAVAHLGSDLPAGDASRLGADGFLLFVGRLRVRKGVEVLLAALARLHAAGAAARLLVVGDGEHHGALVAAAAELGLSEQVVFAGRLGPEAVRSALRRCRALVVPSTYEGMPLVILEAMEEAVPVVASAVSGIPEVVSDRVTGWLVPPEDPEALAVALREVIEDPEQARRRGAVGRQRLEESFRPAQAVAAWRRHVESALRADLEQDVRIMERDG